MGLLDFVQRMACGTAAGCVGEKLPLVIQCVDFVQACFFV